MRAEFIESILQHQALFQLDLPADQIGRLADFYELIEQNNTLLHLVAPCSAEEFAIRHILESLALLEFLPKGSIFADVGAGAGLPSIPCLLMHEDLRATLIESKIKKADFLLRATKSLGVQSRVDVVNRQFEEVSAGNWVTVTCRALDKFVDKLPRLIKWAGKRDLLLFGGPALRSVLEKERLRFDEKLLPLSERRYLFIVR